MPERRSRRRRPPIYAIEPVALIPVDDYFWIRSITDADVMAIRQVSGYVRWNGMLPCDEQAASEWIQRWRGMQQCPITVRDSRVVIGPPYIHLLIEPRWADGSQAPYGICAFDLIGDETIDGVRVRSADLSFQTDPVQGGVIDLTEIALPMLLDFGFKAAIDKGLQLDRVTIRIREADALVLDAVKTVMRLVFRDLGTRSRDGNQYMHTWVLVKSEWDRLRYHFFN